MKLLKILREYWQVVVFLAIAVTVVVIYLFENDFYLGASA